MGIDTGLTTCERIANRQTGVDDNLPTHAPAMERETGIEPVSLAWKAKVLPLNYSRPGARLLNSLHRHFCRCSEPENVRFGGGGWIRTSVRVSGQIYSLLPLTTRPPLRSEPATIAQHFFAAKVFLKKHPQGHLARHTRHPRRGATIPIRYQASNVGAPPADRPSPRTPPRSPAGARCGFTPIARARQQGKHGQTTGSKVALRGAIVASHWLHLMSLGVPGECQLAGLVRSGSAS